MKKFTVMMIALLSVMVAFAAGPKRQVNPQLFAPAKANVQLGQQLNAKHAPQAVATRMQAAKARGLKKVAASAAELVGDYEWEYSTSSEYAIDPTTVEGTAGSSRVSIAAGEDENEVTVSGMFPNDLTGTYYPDYGILLITGGQIAGTSSYGDYAIYGLSYDEGDEENEAGWGLDHIYILVNEDGTLTVADWLIRILSGGDYDGYTLTPYWMPGSTLTPADPLEVVVAPEGMETTECVISYYDRNGNAMSHPIFVGYSGTEIYIKGLATYLPEAWVKGTINPITMTATLPAKQYFGNYAGAYDMFLNSLEGEDVVLTIDASTMKATAQNEYFLVDNSQYYFDWYANAVATPVVEKAVMPADPAITAMTNGSYGWYINFNVPVVDVNGDGLVSSKLSYQIFVDVEREVSPLTFTPATHTYLTEDMTIIPYGFTEDWDFYDGTIYLNDLYSASWNKIGIKSIYTGGGETNETEIQWFDIKDYSVATVTATFNFNAMDVATSSSDSTNGDITEDYTLESDEGIVLTISPKTTSSTENRFWSTNAGPQLRCYSGTLTFEAPEGFTITNIVFNYNAAYWGGNNNGGKVTADSGTIEDNASLHAAGWSGDAATVVFTISANTQLNSIVVTCKEVGGSEPVEDDVPVVLPEGVTPETWYFTASSYFGKVKGEEVAVAFVDNDIYIQGINYDYLPEAWVKGTLNGDGTATFANGQYFGAFEYQGESYDMFFCGSSDGETLSDVTFDVDMENGIISTDDYVLINDNTTEVSFYDYFYDVQITREKPEFPEPLVAPADLVTEPYIFKGFDTYYEEEESGRQVKVGFYGENEVWFHGLSYYVSDAWVMGTIDEEGLVTIPETYLGVYSSFYGDYELTLTPMEFVYDSEAETFYSEAGFQSIDDSGYAMDEYEDVLLTKVIEKEATPADPSVANFALYYTPSEGDTELQVRKFPYAEFDIPTVDVNGEPMVQDKLSYVVYIVDANDEQKELTIAADLYPTLLTEDMTEIPYAFDDDYDIYAGGSTFYLNQAPEEIAAWKKIGVQSIYRGLDIEHRSNIGWFDIEAYTAELSAMITTGISGLTLDSENARYFDLQGRAVESNQKGMLIMQTTDAQGNLKTVKVVRK